MPMVDTLHLEIPSPLNPLGVKGLGYGGAVGAHAEVANALAETLRQVGVEVRETPLSLARVGELLMQGNQPRM